MDIILNGSDGYAWQDAQGRCGLVVHNADGTTESHYMIDDEWFTEDGRSIGGEYARLLDGAYAMIAHVPAASMSEHRVLAS